MNHHHPHYYFVNLIYNKIAEDLCFDEMIFLFKILYIEKIKMKQIHFSLESYCVTKEKCLPRIRVKTTR